MPHVRICAGGRPQGRSLPRPYDPRVPQPQTGKRGPKAKKGPRLPSPKAAASQADRKRTTAGDWLGQEVQVTAAGASRALRAVS
jgi:hypothetical protein